MLCALSAASCAHPNRITRGALDKVTKSGELFVLVFGSVSTSTAALARPEIRFVHPANGAAPESTLSTLTITSGDRFYAVLHAPPSMPYLDGFYTEVGSVPMGFDRVIYARIREGQAPVAMYVGELAISPAEQRAAQGQKVVVTARDDLQNAEKELRRLYPRFEGAVAKAMPRR